MGEKGRFKALTSTGYGANIPSSVTALRVATAPLFLYTIISGLETWTEGFFLLACATDLLDGYLARKLSASSDIGAYFDVTADFFVIMSTFVAFVVISIYPFWLLAIIAFMFAQFMATSNVRRPIYDPVGRYYGTFLFAAIGLTLAFPSPALCLFVSATITILTVASVTSRCVTICKLLLERKTALR